MNHLNLILQDQRRVNRLIQHLVFGILILLLPALLQAQNDPLIADFSGNPTSGCKGMTVKFEDKSVNAIQWIWSFPGGEPSAAQGQGPHNITYSKVGTYSVTLEVLSEFGTSDQKHRQNYIEIKDCSPDADFNVQNNTGCIPLVVTYTDDSEDANTWSWSFPNGKPSSASGQGPHEVEYTTEGTFDATLYVTNQYGQDSKTRNDIIDARLCLYEFGDAPEGVVAYPSSGVIGNFPTCKDVGPAGYIQHARDSGTMLGYKVDFESDGNEGRCSAFHPNLYDQDESCDELEACLIRPDNYTITGTAGAESVVPFCVDEGVLLGSPCGLAVWGPDINIVWDTDNAEGAYVNILIDWNQDGEWGASGTCPRGTWDEHALVNFPVPLGNGNLITLSPPNIRIGPNSGYVWMRVTITDEEIELPWDGSGEYNTGETEDHLIRISEVIDLFDFGDAPEPYKTLLQVDGARHIIDSDVFLGQGIDDETDGQPDTTATGDDLDGNDDEDGVEWLQELVPNDTALVRITASAGGFLKAWIDWNRDGDWDDEEETACSVQIGEGANDLQIIVPADAMQGFTCARFRYSEEPIASYDGPSNSGEVEDEWIYIEDVIYYDYGDAPDDEEYNYPTLLEHNGARHTVSNEIYLIDMRQTDGGFADLLPPPDMEKDGQPTLDARGDNDNNEDDERGTFFWQPLVPGDTSSIIVLAGGVGRLFGWFDWNQDGDWNDPDEYVIKRYFGPSDMWFWGAAYYGRVEVPVPATASLGETYARFRYSSDTKLRAFGRGGNGEVEDVKVTVVSELYDYGDAPNSYGTLKPDGASHQIAKLIMLGNKVDAESNGDPGDEALGDNLNHENDEDGVIFSTISPGFITNIVITTYDGFASGGYIHAWIDFNQDGDFEDAGEKIIDGIQEEGTHTHAVSIPSDACIGYTYARFRYSYDQILGPNGRSDKEGEVEDYRIEIGGSLLDYGDAPAPFFTSLQQDGARHVIDSTVYMGSGVSADADGTADSLAAADDDDGVTFQGEWIVGDTVTAFITVSDTGYISVWGSYGSENGYIIGLAENVEIMPVPKPGSPPNSNEIEAIEYKIPVPIGTPVGVAYLRFRYSTEPVDSSHGIALDGEVEDYRIRIYPYDEYKEFGDAPEGVVAYPSSGVIGNFPTCKDVGPAGYIQHARDSGTMLGYKVDFEIDGNEGKCSVFHPNLYDQDESCDELEACLIRPDNYTITGTAGAESVVPFCVDEGVLLGSPCGLAVWGPDINIVWDTDNAEGAYVNILIDWNQDGEWGASGACSGGTWDEHALVNFPVPLGNGNLITLSPPNIRIGPNSGYVWMRVTITDEEIELPWDGSGDFDSGETEDHLIRISEIIELLDFGDAPAPFKTLHQMDGARHVIDATVYLGSGVSADTDGTADSLASADDDDGVTFINEWIPGDTALLNINPSVDGYLGIWYAPVDFEGSIKVMDDFVYQLEKVKAVLKDGGSLSVEVEESKFKWGEDYLLRFRFSTDSNFTHFGPAPDGEVEDYLVTIAAPPIYDFGDAPDNDTLHYETLLANNGARHLVCDTIYIGYGSIPTTAEPDGQPGITANNDNGYREENGINFYSYLSPGEADSIWVNMYGPGYLHGWIDFNRDGDFHDSGEYIIQYDNSTAPLGFVNRFLAFMTPASAVPGDAFTYVRFRYSTDPPPFTPGGPGGRGEVEDHRIIIYENIYDYGDAPDSYNTTGTDAARHPIMGCRLGSDVDSESTGQPGIHADGDDTDSDGNDDDGLVEITPLIPGESSVISVWTQRAGYLYAWIDFNIDGDWDDPGENILSGIGGVWGDTLDLIIDVPVDAVTGNSYARFRYVDYWWMPPSAPPPVVNSYGTSYTGEVEDYKIRIGTETGIDETDSNINPIEYALQQNYPNPFNPVTGIQFSIPEQVHVHLNVYNLYGQEVCEIINEEKSVGNYSVQWNGRDKQNRQVGSGIYIIHLRAGNFNQTRKIILMK